MTKTIEELQAALDREIEYSRKLNDKDRSVTRTA